MTLSRAPSSTHTTEVGDNATTAGGQDEGEEECEDTRNRAPWRLVVPECECPMKSVHCLSSTATREEIFQAAKTGDNAVLSWYLERCLDETLTARDSFGRTITHYLAEVKDSQAMAGVIWCLDSTFHIDRPEQNRWGRTQIMLAVESGNLEVVKLLVAERVRLRLKSEEGKRLQDYASKHPHIEQYFEQLYNGKIDYGVSLVAQKNKGQVPTSPREAKSPRGKKAGESGDAPKLSLNTGTLNRGVDHLMVPHNWRRHDKTSGTRSTHTSNPQAEEAARNKIRAKKRGERLIQLPRSAQPRSQMQALTAARQVWTEGGRSAKGYGMLETDGTGRSEYLQACETGSIKIRTTILSQLGGGHGHLCLKGDSTRKDVPALSAVLKGSRRLHRVHFEECIFGDVASASLAASFSSQSYKGIISSLSLIRCGLRGAAAFSLANAIRGGRMPDLTSLTLDHNDLTDTGVEAIASAFTAHKTPSISVLSLSHCGISMCGTRAVASVERLLASPHVQLQDLDLAWNSIDSKGAASLLSTLATNTALTSLSIAYNRVGSHGAAALEAALPSNASLQRIDMTSCGLSPADSKAVITALLGAKGLQIAKIDLNNFGIDGAERLASSLQSKGIRYCMTEENGGSLGKGAFEQMVASFDEASPSGRFSLLLSNPKHREVAEKLLNQAEIFDGECWRNETYNGRRFSWDKGYVLPAQGRLDLDMVHLEPNEVERYGEMQEADFTSLLKVLRNQRSSSSRLALIRKMTAQYIFTAERASQLLFIFDCGEERITAAVAIVPRITDRDENMYMAMSPLSITSKEEVVRRCGPHMFFDGVRCAKFGFCHKFQVDLAKTLDHRFVKRLVEMCKGDALSHRFVLAEFEDGRFSGPWNAALYSLDLFDGSMKTLDGGGLTDGAVGKPRWDYERVEGRVRQLPSSGTLVVLWEFQGWTEEDEESDQQVSTHLSLERQTRLKNLVSNLAEEEEEDKHGVMNRPAVFSSMNLTDSTHNLRSFLSSPNRLNTGSSSNSEDALVPVIPPDSVMAKALRRLSGGEFSTLIASRVPLFRRTPRTTPNASPIMAVRRPHTHRGSMTIVPSGGSAPSSRRGTFLQPPIVRKPGTAPSVGTTLPLEVFSESRTRRGTWTIEGGGGTSRPTTEAGIFSQSAKIMKYEQAKKLDLKDTAHVKEVLLDVVGAYRRSKLADRSSDGGKKSRGAPTLSVRTDTRKRWMCPVCKMQFVQEGNLIFHIEGTHLKDDLGRAEHQKRMEVIIRCEGVEEKVKVLDELLSSQDVTGVMTDRRRREAEDEEFVAKVDNFDFEEASEDSDEGNQGAGLRPEFLGPKKKREKVVMPPRPVSSFKELSFHPHLAEWEFTPEQGEADIEKFDHIDSEGGHMLTKPMLHAAKPTPKEPPTQSLDEVLIQRRTDLLRKYREMSALSSAPKKTGPVSHAKVMWKRDSIVGGMLPLVPKANTDSLAHEQRLITQERHFDVLSWMDA